MTADAGTRPDDPFGAITALSARNRVEPDHVTEEQLVRRRLEAFAALDRTPRSVASWPPVVDDVFGDRTGPPEITRDELSATLLHAAIQHHGCLLVRGLLAPASIERLVDDVERAFAAFDESERVVPDAADPLVPVPPWFVPFEPGPGELVIGEPWDPLIPRRWARSGGALYAVDAPRALFDVLEAFDGAGLPAVLEEYLGERAAISVKKVALRRTTGDLDAEWWHQDGAFLGEQTRALNVWVALSECGVDAPGLDIVDRRLDHVVETGTGDARFDWSVGSQTVARVSEGKPLARPVFGPGDALLFDHLLLHKTAVDPAMTQIRYAIETWFFTPSTFPIDQIPLAY
jgi:hypothetical protein